MLFTNELEILTLRWKQLYPYITEFVVLESNSTFTGFPKALVFNSNREQFKFVEPRLTYGTIGGRFKKGENPFVEEAYQRVALDQLLKIAGINVYLQPLIDDLKKLWNGVLTYDISRKKNIMMKAALT